MSSKMTAKVEIVADLEATGTEGREYCRPEVHDLGNLEQVQGGTGGNKLDFMLSYFPA